MDPRVDPPPWPTDAIGIGAGFVVAVVAALVPAWSAPLKAGGVAAALGLGAGYVALVRHIRAARSRRERHEAALRRAEEDLAVAEGRISSLDEQRDRLELELADARQRETQASSAFEQLSQKSQELAQIALDEIAERDAELAVRRRHDDWMRAEW